MDLEGSHDVENLRKLMHRFYGKPVASSSVLVAIHARPGTTDYRWMVTCCGYN